MKQSDRKRYLTIALLGLFLLLVGIVWKKADRPSGPDSSGHASATQQITEEPSQYDVRSATRNRTAASTQKLPSHSFTELHDFFLPSLELDGMSLRQALNALLDQYYQTCQRTGEQPHLLKVEITGTPLQPLQVTLPNAPFLAQLEMLSALAGMRMAHNGGVLQFSEIEAADKTVSRSIVVPPDITSRIAELSGSRTKHTEPSDPFLTGSVEINKTNPGDHLRQLFAIDPFQDGHQNLVQYIPATTTLVIKASERDTKRISAFLDAVIKNPPTQIKTSTIKVFLPPGSKLDPSDPNLLAKLSREDGVDIMTSPSIISRSGQKAVIEIVRSHPQAGGKSDWTGIKYNSNVSPLGFGFQSSITQQTGIESPNRTSTVKDIKYATTSRDSFTKRGGMLLIPTGIEGEKLTYLMHSHTEVSATGTPVIRSRDKPMPKK